MAIKLHLPWPPSTNSLYPGIRRRHKSKQYEAWILEAGYMLNMQWNADCIEIPVCVTYLVGKPRNKKGSASKVRMDLCNREKALSDLLVSYQVLQDDSLIHRLVMQWSDIEGVDVLIEPYMESPSQKSS